MNDDVMEVEGMVKAKAKAKLWVWTVWVKAWVKAREKEVATMAVLTMMIPKLTLMPQPEAPAQEKT
jgi:hypothetical protein